MKGRVLLSILASVLLFALVGASNASSAGRELGSSKVPETTSVAVLSVEGMT